MKISSVMGCHDFGDSSATVPARDIFALFEATAFVVVTRHEQARGLVVGDLQIKVACMHHGCIRDSEAKRLSALLAYLPFI